MADALLNSGTSAGEAQALPSKPIANGRPAKESRYKNSKHFLNPDEAAQVLSIRFDKKGLERK